MHEIRFENASPLPWEWGENPGAKEMASNELVIRPVGQFPPGSWVADVGRKHDDQARANAEMIVRAVNSCMAVRVSELIGFCESVGKEREAQALMNIYAEYLHATKRTIPRP